MNQSTLMSPKDLTNYSTHGMFGNNQCKKMVKLIAPCLSLIKQKLNFEGKVLVNNHSVSEYYVGVD